jgi:hypothetical protein
VLGCFLNPDFYPECLASVFQFLFLNSQFLFLSYWLVFRWVVPGLHDPLDPLSLNGFAGSCRVTRENSRVYPLDPFI